MLSSHDTLQHSRASSRALRTSARAPSAHHGITQEPHAAGFGHGHPRCALAAPSLHRGRRRRTWRRWHAVTQGPCRALHVVPVRSREPRGCRSIESSTLVELRLGPAARAGGERSAQPHPSWCAHERRAHLMAAKKSVARRPSTRLRHKHAARCQHWPLMQSPQRAAAAAACESSGAGATWWTAANMDGRPRGRWSFTPRGQPLL